MTKETREKLNHMCDIYKSCCIIDGPLHAKENERRVRELETDRNMGAHEFVRVTADLTYLFWNPKEKH